jgi:hypothetical protein
MVIDKVRNDPRFSYLPKDSHKYFYTPVFIVADVSLCRESHKGHYRAHAEHTRLNEYL